MLGGNPDEGRKIFLKTIKEQPHNWLARVAYIQFYLIPQSDEDGYKAQKFHLEKYQSLAEDQMKWSPNSRASKDPAFGNKNIRFFQALAIERYKIISKYEKEFF